MQVYIICIIRLALSHTFRPPSSRSEAPRAPPPTRTCSKCATTAQPNDMQIHPQVIHRGGRLQASGCPPLTHLSPKTAGPTTSGPTPPRSRSRAGWIGSRAPFAFRTVEPRLRRFQSQSRVLRTGASSSSAQDACQNPYAEANAPAGHPGRSQSRTNTLQTQRSPVLGHPTRSALQTPTRAGLR